MKIFLMTDMEGVSGAAVFSAYGLPPNPQIAGVLKLMMKEINAAIEGCFAGGATEVIVHEAHGFDLEALDPRARIVRGGNLLNTLDPSFDAMMFVGQHAMSLTADGVLAHTGSSRSIVEVKINSEPVGELAIFGAVAGAHGVPVVFVSGDRAGCREARELFGDIETAEVMEGLGNHSAICLSNAAACGLIREGARKSLGAVHKIAPLKYPSPVRIFVRLKAPALADTFCLIPGIERVDSTTVSYQADNYLQVFQVGYLCLGVVLNRWDRNPGH